MKKILKNKYFWLVTVLTIIGFGLRFFAARALGSYWFDEYFGVYFTKFSFTKMTSYLILDTNLPLYNIFLWLWLKMFKETELTVRFLSIIFGVINIPLLYFVGKKLFSRISAVVALIFYVFSVFQIHHTSEARVYALIIFFGLLSCWFFWKIIQEKESLGNWLGYIISTLLLAYTHLTSSFFILAQVIFIFITFWQKKKQLIKWALSFLIITLLTLPYLIIFYLNKQEIAFTGWHYNLPYERHFFGEILRSFFAYLNSNSRLEPLFILLPLLMAGSFIFFKRTDKKSKFLLDLRFSPAVSFCWLVVITSLIISFLLNWNIPRYLILTSIFIYLLIGQGIENWFRDKKAKIIILTIIILLLVNPYGNLFTKRDYWRKIGQCLNQIKQANAKIVVHNFAYEPLLKRYYQGIVPVEGFYPLADSLTYEERIIKNNWRPIVNSENVNKLSNNIKGFTNIYLVEILSASVLDRERAVFFWFLNNGWKMGKKLICQIEDIEVYNFTPPLEH